MSCLEPACEFQSVMMWWFKILPFLLCFWQLSLLNAGTVQMSHVIWKAVFDLVMSNLIIWRVIYDHAAVQNSEDQSLWWWQASGAWGTSDRRVRTGGVKNHSLSSSVSFSLLLSFLSINRLSISPLNLYFGFFYIKYITSSIFKKKKNY